MKKPYWKIGTIAVIACVLLLALVAGLYVNSVGLDNVKLMYRLHASESEGTILRMSDDGDYLAMASHAREKLKVRMSSEGWSFVEQEGAGYFFERDGDRVIVTTTLMWGGDYIRYRVSDQTVDLASQE